MAKSRGIIESGKGNHKLVTVFRISGDVAHLVTNSCVAKHSPKTADLRLSAGASRAAATVSETSAATDIVLGAAAVWAANRGSKRVWDVDVACALGYDPTPEGVTRFRRELGLPTPSTPWPTRPDQNPKEGPVVDREGHVVS